MRRTWKGLIVVASLTAGLALAAAPLVLAAQGDPPAARPQTRCPVMGGAINRAQYVDVEGYRVYVCCPGCRRAVAADPKKYIAAIRARGEEPQRLTAAKPAPTATAAAKTPVGAYPGRVPTSINTATLATLLRAGVPLVLLDARTGKWNDGRLIPGATILSPNATEAEIARRIPSKNALVVTYCTNLKCMASALLGERLRKLGYKNVLEYPEGIEGWAAAGKPIERVKTR